MVDMPSNQTQPNKGILDTIQNSKTEDQPQVVV